MSDDERLARAIRESFADERAPAVLGERIGAAVRKRERGGPPAGARRGWLLAAATLAGVAFLAGRVSVSSPVQTTVGEDGETYALVLDTVTRDYSALDGEQARSLAERYSAWTERVRAGGRLVGSVYLESAESVDGLEALSGILLVRATSRAEALAIARDGPHLERGGTVSVRRVAALE